MSRNPGIGKGWYDKYKDDVYPHDYVIVNGVKCRPPRYYDNQLKAERPYEFENLQFDRIDKMDEQAHNNTPERLAVREEVTNARISKLVRNLET